MYLLFGNASVALEAVKRSSTVATPMKDKTETHVVGNDLKHCEPALPVGHNRNNFEKILWP
jgi:hypothetical protein